MGDAAPTQKSPISARAHERRDARWKGHSEDEELEMNGFLVESHGEARRCASIAFALSCLELLDRSGQLFGD